MLELMWSQDTIVMKGLCPQICLFLAFKLETYVSLAMGQSSRMLNSVVFSTKVFPATSMFGLIIPCKEKTHCRYCPQNTK